MPKSPAQLDREIAEALGSRSIRDKYKRAKALVDGRVVRDSIPNRSSIAASLNNYDILPGVREIPLSEFDPGPPSYYSVSEAKWTKRLAEQIRHSGEINPLIVVEDAEGPYITASTRSGNWVRERSRTS